MTTFPVAKPVRLQVGLDWTPPPEGRWVVVWYRQVLPRRQGDDALPLVNIALRNLGPPDGANWREFSRLDRPVTELGCLRLGTIVEDGRVIERVDLGPCRDFPVEFPEGPGGGGLIKQSKELESLTADLPSWFAGVSLGGRALAFPLPGGGSLWIPCMEFFSRFYGRSQEIKRALLAYPWQWATECLIGAEPAEPVPTESASDPQEWRVQFGWGAPRLVPDDAVFLAHLRYSPMTQRSARRLGAQMEAAHPTIASGSREGVYLEVEPWFSGPADLRVGGYPLPDGGFLALRLEGGTDPSGPRVVRERRRPARVGPGGRRKTGAASVDVRSRGVVLDRDQHPPGRTRYRRLPDEPFEVLGKRQIVEDVPSDSSAPVGVGASRVPVNADEALSTAEPSGSWGGVDSVVVSASPRSALRDLWDALRSLWKRYPKYILNLEGYDPSSGFVPDRIPLFIHLAPKPFGAPRDSTRVDRQWDGGATGIPAGMVARAIVADDRAPHGRRALYFVVVERGVTPEGRGKKLEGLIFELPPDGSSGGQSLAWLTKLRRELVQTRGVFGSEVYAACPGRPELFDYLPFKHRRRGEPTVRNAFRKMGFVLPDSARRTSADPPPLS